MIDADERHLSGRIRSVQSAGSDVVPAPDEPSDRTISGSPDIAASVSPRASEIAEAKRAAHAEPIRTSSPRLAVVERKWDADARYSARDADTTRFQRRDQAL